MPDQVNNILSYFPSKPKTNSFYLQFFDGLIISKRRNSTLFNLKIFQI